MVGLWHLCTYLYIYLLWTFNGKVHAFLLALFGLSQLVCHNLHIYGLQGDDLIHVGMAHVFVVAFKTFSSRYFKVWNAPLTVVFLLCYRTQNCNIRPINQFFPIPPVFPSLASAYHCSPIDLYYIIYFNIYKWCHVFLYAWLISVYIMSFRFILLSQVVI